MWGCGRWRGWDRLLEGLGFNGRQRAVAVGSITDGAAGVGEGELALAVRRSGLGELLEVDFEAMSLMRLYRVSDALMAHREAIEKHLFEQVTELFGLGHTVTLYDLTNTFFEGEAKDQPKAQRGHSKEKALCTADPGAGLDGSGFVPKCLPAGSTKTRWSRCSGARARRRPGGDGRGLPPRITWPGCATTAPTVVSRQRNPEQHRDPVAPQGSPAQGGG